MNSQTQSSLNIYGLDTLNQAHFSLGAPTVEDAVFVGMSRQAARSAPKARLAVDIASDRITIGREDGEALQILVPANASEATELRVPVLSQPVGQLVLHHSEAQGWSLDPSIDVSKPFILEDFFRAVSASARRQQQQA